MSHFIFPAEGKVLNPQQLIRNPTKPHRLHESQSSADYFRVMLKLKGSTDDDAIVKFEPADLWWLGSEADVAARNVFPHVQVRHLAFEFTLLTLRLTH